MVSQTMGESKMSEKPQKTLPYAVAQDLSVGLERDSEATIKLTSAKSHPLLY